MIEASPNPCTWKKDAGMYHDYWTTSCANEFWFEVDGPKENGFNFCPYCGGPVEVYEGEF